jgi:hypothetical protein
MHRRCCRQSPAAHPSSANGPRTCSACSNRRRRARPRCSSTSGHSRRAACSSAAGCTENPLAARTWGEGQKGSNRGQPLIGWLGCGQSAANISLARPASRIKCDKPGAKLAAAQPSEGSASDAAILPSLLPPATEAKADSESRIKKQIQKAESERSHGEPLAHIVSCSRPHQGVVEQRERADVVAAWRRPVAGARWA